MSLDLNAIRARQGRYEKWVGTGFDTELLRHAAASADDVPVLLAEIERLTALFQAAVDAHGQLVDELAALRRGADTPTTVQEGPA